MSFLNGRETFKEMTMFNRTCVHCGKEFQSQRRNSTTCYGCALNRLTGDSGPEEGDINTALLTSGEMSDEDARQLQADLESVDHSREEELERRMVEEYGPPNDCYLEEDDEWTR